MWCNQFKGNHPKTHLTKFGYKPYIKKFRKYKYLFMFLDTYYENFVIWFFPLKFDEFFSFFYWKVLNSMSWKLKSDFLGQNLSKIHPKLFTNVKVWIFKCWDKSN